ncbi:MAG: hypothetical protein ACREYE_17600, partial [Gammaproteobacteria bacterium]
MCRIELVYVSSVLVSLFQNGMSLNLAACFQRGMSLKGGEGIDHRGHGDRHERETAGHAEAAEEFLAATAEVEFQGCGQDEERYRHIEGVIKRFGYGRLKKPDK